MRKFIKKHPVLVGTLLALSVAWLVCRKEVKQYVDVSREIQQHTKVIDPKYLEMLKQQPSIKDRINSFLNDTIDKLITGAICDVSDQPLPPELGFKAVHIGQHKLNKRKLIVGEMDDNRSVHVEFSADFQYGYVAKSGFGGYEEIKLLPETENAVKQLFGTVDNKIRTMSRSALLGDPIAESLLEFLSETRYGSNDYLCNEFTEIYQKTVNRMSSELPDEVRNTVVDAFCNLTITDIRQFLKENNVDPDTADVHVID